MNCRLVRVYKEESLEHIYSIKPRTMFAVYHERKPYVCTLEYDEVRGYYFQGYMKEYEKRTFSFKEAQKIYRLISH